MAYILQNKLVKIEIDQPGENYKGSRFDWTAKITQLTFDNKYTFCSTETPTGDNSESKGQGLYNEFGIKQAIGFEACKPGEKFPKLGVGFLTRPDDKPYNFCRSYTFEPFEFVIEEKKSEILFRVVQALCNGYASVLTKIISLQEKGFTIDYELENTGHQNIETSEYCHNFLAINRLGMGPGYELSFPFPIKLNEQMEQVNPENAIEIGGNIVQFLSYPGKEFFYGPIDWENDYIGHWKLIHKGIGVGISETTDFVPANTNVWGWGHVISPELFHTINLEPGHKTNWKRKYEFFTI